MMLYEIVYSLKGISTELWPLIPLLMLGLLIRSSWYKRVVGKQKVGYWIKKYLDPHIYHPLKNVVLPTENGKLHIDYIVVSVYGVFVIGVTYAPGFISGNESDATWKRMVNGKEAEITNPSRTNRKKTRLFAKLLELSKDQVFPILICQGECEFSSQMPDYVVQDDHFVRYISLQENYKLTHDDVQSTLAKAKGNRLTQSQKELFKPKCPKCGGKMVVRKAKTGKFRGKRFLGCKEFPSCRGRLSIKGSVQFTS